MLGPKVCMITSVVISALLLLLIFVETYAQQNVSLYVYYYPDWGRMHTD